MVTTEERACFLQAMTDDSDTAGSAYRSQSVNRAFEAVEYVLRIVFDYFESFVVVVPTGFAFRHGFDLSGVRETRWSAL
jgi:hypothetical protein